MVNTVEQEKILNCYIACKKMFILLVINSSMYLSAIRNVSIFSLAQISKVKNMIKNGVFFLTPIGSPLMQYRNERKISVTIDPPAKYVLCNVIRFLEAEGIMRQKFIGGQRRTSAVKEELSSKFKVSPFQHGDRKP